MTNTSAVEDRAIVIGASMAGLMTARVLCDYFHEVVVVERDPPPTGPHARKGVPQGRHTHAVLEAGANVLERLFPGLWSQLQAAGTRYTDLASDWRWFHHGVWKQRQSMGMHMYCQSRPMLEWHVLERLRECHGVELRHGHVVERLHYDAAASRVTGVEVRPRDESATTTLCAALVVDASGRGTQVPRWLESLGYGRPPTTEVRTNIGYASRMVRLAEDPSRDWQCMLVYPRAPHQTRVGYIFPIENDRHIVTLVGYCGDHPPADESSFMAFARDVPVPEYYATLRQAEPLSPIHTHRLPGNLRRHYDRLDRFPEGLAVLGDALCSFNPLFGQGMTTAALGADALDRCLARRRPMTPADRVRGLAAEFWREVSPTNDLAWLLATTEDLRYPKAEGQRPFGIGVLHRYIEGLARASAVDLEVHRRFLEVMSFRRGIGSLLTPSMFARVLRANLRPVALEAASPFPARSPAPSVHAAE